MLSASLPEELFGNWSKMVEDWRTKNPQKHARNGAEKEEREKLETEAKRQRDESVNEIATILQAHRLSSMNRTVLVTDEMEKPNDRGETEHIVDEDQLAGGTHSLHSVPTTTPSNDKSYE